MQLRFQPCSSEQVSAPRPRLPGPTQLEPSVPRKSMSSGDLVRLRQAHLQTLPRLYT